MKNKIHKQVLKETPKKRKNMFKGIVLLLLFCLFSTNVYASNRLIAEGKIKEIRYITSLNRDAFSEQYDKTVIIFEDNHTIILNLIQNIPCGGDIKIYQHEWACNKYYFECTK